MVKSGSSDLTAGTRHHHLAEKKERSSRADRGLSCSVALYNGYSVCIESEPIGLRTKIVA